MRKKSLIVIFIILHINAFSQKKVSLPFSKYYNENAIVSFGIQYNAVFQNYILDLKENWQDYPIDYPQNDISHLGNLKSIESKSGTAFSVGIPIDWRLDPNWYLTATPSFLFGNNLGIEYQSINSENSLLRKSRHQINSTNGSNFNAFEIPINIKLRSDEKILKNKINRYRAYVNSGLRYTKWLGTNKEYQNISSENTSDPLILKPHYLSWEVGLGVEIFFDSFRISPELKFNQSLTNVFETESTGSLNNKFMRPIEKGFIRNIYLGLILQ